MWLRNIYLIAQPPLLAVMRGGESPLQKYTSKMYRALPLPLHAPLSDLLNRNLDTSAPEGRGTAGMSFGSVREFNEVLLTHDSDNSFDVRRQDAIVRNVRNAAT